MWFGNAYLGKGLSSVPTGHRSFPLAATGVTAQYDYGIL